MGSVYGVLWGYWPLISVGYREVWDVIRLCRVPRELWPLLSLLMFMVFLPFVRLWRVLWCYWSSKGCTMGVLEVDESRYRVPWDSWSLISQLQFIVF